MRSKKHYFIVRVGFTKAVTRSEALEAVKDSGQMGLGASDYFNLYSNDRNVDGEMFVRSIKHKGRK